MASDDVIISDGDVGAVVESVEVELVMGRDGDRLIFVGDICPDSYDTTCHLRYQ